MSGANETRPSADSPRSAEEALREAAAHARRALAEGIAALRALLDAGSLLASGEPSEAHRALAGLSRSLDDLSRGIAGDEPRVSAPLIAAILDALEQEIGRWETRSRDDPEARAVLRAFLGVREILWEFGLRPADAEAKGPAGASPSSEKRPRSRSPARAKPRVQRVPIES